MMRWTSWFARLPYTTLFRSAGEVIDEEEVDVAPGSTATVDVPPVSGATFSRAVVQPQAPDTLVAARWTRRAASEGDRKSTRLNSSHVAISYAVFCLKTQTIT